MELKRELFMNLYRISTVNKFEYLYDYFKNPERVVEIDESNSGLLEVYMFALSLAKKNKKFDDVLMLVHKILSLSEDSGTPVQWLLHPEVNPIHYMLEHPELIFKIEELRQYMVIDEYLTQNKDGNGTRYNSFVNPVAIDKDDEEETMNIKMAKLVQLANKSRVWNLDELNKELTLDGKQSSLKDTQRVILNAMRHKLLEGKINQKEKIVRFHKVNQFFTEGQGETKFVDRVKAQTRERAKMLAKQDN